jgi:hypothetical protein
MTPSTKRSDWLDRPARLAGAGLVVLEVLLAGCGGAGNPLGNPSTIENEAVVGSQKLSFIYFQNCVNPIFLAQLQINQGGVTSLNSCSASGCHDNTNGTGGAFRVIGQAQPLDLGSLAGDPQSARASDMYKNFYSAQGEVVFTAPLDSRLLAKPLLRGVLHGGGLIFDSTDDENVKRIEYWITHPMPHGQDEFSTAAAAMFTPADPATGACNTE